MKSSIILPQHQNYKAYRFWISLSFAWIAVLLFSCQDMEGDEMIPPPSAKFSYFSDNDMKATSNIKFVNESERAENYNWRFGDQTVSVEKSPIHQYKVPGKYIVTLVVSSKNGMDSLKKEMEILVPDITAEFSFASNNEFRNPTHINFINHSKNATSFTWDFGDGTESSEFNPTHTYTIPGTYTVTMKASDGNKSAESEATFVVTPLNPDTATIIIPPPSN